jgi:hypothetical protein
MHPDIARQLAADRHADFQRGVSARPAPASTPKRLTRRRHALARYAGALTGARSGT